MVHKNPLGDFSFVTLQLTCHFDTQGDSNKETVIDTTHYKAVINQYD